MRDLIKDIKAEIAKPEIHQWTDTKGMMSLKHLRSCCLECQIVMLTCRIERPFGPQLASLGSLHHSTHFIASIEFSTSFNVSGILAWSWTRLVQLMRVTRSNTLHRAFQATIVTTIIPVNNCQAAIARSFVIGSKPTTRSLMWVSTYVPDLEDPVKHATPELVIFGTSPRNVHSFRRNRP